MQPYKWIAGTEEFLPVQPTRSICRSRRDVTPAAAAEEAEEEEEEEATAEEEAKKQQ